MIVYKVLYQKSKKLYSINACINKCPAVVRYIKNHWTYPKFEGSKLFAFSTHSDATEFARLFDGVVYEAIAINPTRRIVGLKHIIYTGAQTNEWFYKRFWKNLQSPFGTSLYDIPINTVFCDGMMIRRKV